MSLCQFHEFMVHWNSRTIDEIVVPWVSKITDAPLPFAPGADAAFYLEIEAARCQAASELCADFLAMIRRSQGDATAEAARSELEAVREDLLRRYPHAALFLDAETWPAAVSIH